MIFSLCCFGWNYRKACHNHTWSTLSILWCGPQPFCHLSLTEEHAGELRTWVYTGPTIPLLSKKWYFASGFRVFFPPLFLPNTPAISRKTIFCQWFPRVPPPICVTPFICHLSQGTSLYLITNRNIFTLSLNFVHFQTWRLKEGQRLEKDMHGIFKSIKRSRCLIDGVP